MKSKNQSRGDKRKKNELSSNYSKDSFASESNFSRQEEDSDTSIEIEIETRNAAPGNNNNGSTGAPSKGSAVKLVKKVYIKDEKGNCKTGYELLNSSAAQISPSQSQSGQTNRMNIDHR